MLLMFTTIIADATFSGVLGGYVVQKIFFTAQRRLHLPVPLPHRSAARSTSSSRFIHEHPWATAILVLGERRAGRTCSSASLWPKVVKWWDDAKEGGAILGEPRKYFVRVFCPSFLAWLARPRRDRPSSSPPTTSRSAFTR